MNTICWGILGCGDVTEHKSGPALMQAAGSSVVAVMRRDGAKAADFARRHGVPRWYDDADALLADPEVNAVYIATPPNSHLDLTRRAALAGKRILVEKPMARTVAECDSMIAACEAAGVPLHVAYYRRFYPKFLAAKRLIDSGGIGRPVSVTLQMAKPKSAAPVDPLPWRLRPEISGGGLFMDTGVHRLDIILYLLGDMTDICGQTANLSGAAPAEDSVAFAFRLEDSGALGTVTCHFGLSPIGRDRLEIIGTDAVLLFDSFDAPFFTVQRSDGSVEMHRYPDPTPVHLPLVEALVRVYQGENIAHITGQEGRKTNAIVAQVMGSRNGGGLGQDMTDASGSVGG
jgi:predicted dehydrogenase